MSLTASPRLRKPVVSYAASPCRRGVTPIRDRPRRAENRAIAREMHPGQAQAQAIGALVPPFLVVLLLPFQGGSQYTLRGPIIFLAKD